MREQRQTRRSSGAKAIAIDEQATQARYRLLQLIAVILTATFALSLYLTFGL